MMVLTSGKTKTNEITGYALNFTTKLSDDR